MFLLHRSFRVVVLWILSIVSGWTCFSNNSVYADACGTVVAQLGDGRSTLFPMGLRKIIKGDVRASSVSPTQLKKYAQTLNRTAQVLVGAHFEKDPLNRPSTISLVEGLAPSFVTTERKLTSFEVQYVAEYNGSAQETVIARLTFGPNAKWVVDAKSRGDGS